MWQLQLRDEQVARPHHAAQLVEVLLPEPVIRAGHDDDGVLPGLVYRHHGDPGRRFLDAPDRGRIDALGLEIGDQRGAMGVVADGAHESDLSTHPGSRDLGRYAAGPTCRSLTPTPACWRLPTGGGNGKNNGTTHRRKPLTRPRFFRDDTGRRYPLC